MPRCNNEVYQTVYRGFEIRSVKSRCGQTSVHGDPLECGECRERREKTNAPPPGYCRHGVFINTDHDIPCGRCEFGED